MNSFSLQLIASILYRIPSFSIEHLLIPSYGVGIPSTMKSITSF
ncbi:hypothetical protein UFB30_15995 [Jeotgalibacillus sp. HH7-29]|uniref:Uncharacterized protein n=1 Tax=Jeotgalibacillus haloalkalitolerans TaxID=3104292 RepID=A0ABU5KR70_9BACL|nr:hypothetical protein [Jeotgalibacillus sp. HH7-29]